VKGTVAGAKPSFEARTPMELFDAHLVHAGLDTQFQYDVTEDGKRFLINASLPGVDSALALTLVTNWAVGLRK
jgi:HSP20 family molecular chaperone IbpA